MEGKERMVINIQILQNCTNKTLEQLKNIFNACLSTRYFPDIFKEAIIKFIPKKDKSPLNPINYRRISLLEVPGKMFEKHTSRTQHLFNREEHHKRTSTRFQNIQKHSHRYYNNM